MLLSFKVPLYWNTLIAGWVTKSESSTKVPAHREHLQAAVTAWDKMQDKPFDNSRLALHFEWDATDDAKSRSAHASISLICSAPFLTLPMIQRYSDPAPGASQQRDTRSFSASNSSVPKSPNLNRRECSFLHILRQTSAQWSLAPTAGPYDRPGPPNQPAKGGVVSRSQV